MLVVAQRILIGGIVCLFPLFAYCLVLVGLNSRRRASMIPGPWDFAGVLLANAGFLLVGGPVILAGLNAGWRRYVLHGQVGDWRILSGQGDVRALALWAVYFLTVAIGSAWLLWRRRRVTVFYNADTAHFHTALEWVFGRTAVSWQRDENTYALKRRPPADVAPWLRPDATPQFGQPPLSGRLAVHVLPSSCNVTLIWDADNPALRELVEGELATLLPNMRAAENPALRWMVTVATLLSGVIVCSIVLFLVFAIQLRSRF